MCKSAVSQNPVVVLKRPVTTLLIKYTCLAVLAFSVGCSPQKEAWPPPSPLTELPSSTDTITTLRTGSGGHGQGWDYVYRDDRRLGGTEALGWGMLIVEGERDLPYNLFSITSVASAFADNSYEVVYHDSNRTRVRIRPERNDKVIMWIPDTRRPLNFVDTFSLPGGKVRCGDKTYEIRTNGWFLDGKLVHPFRPSR